MSKPRLTWAVFFAGAGFVYAGLEFWAGHVLGGMVLIATGILAAWPGLFGFADTWGSGWWQLATGICTALSIVVIFQESPLADICQQTAMPDMLTRFWTLAFDSGQAGLDPREQNLAKQGFVRCALQSHIDAAELVKNLIAAENLDPASTITSQVVTDATSAPPNMTCMDYYRELRKSKPILFAIIESQHSCIVPHHQ